jgi:hypothetical protein
MFADDTAGVDSKNNTDDFEIFVNDELKKIARWFRAYSLPHDVAPDFLMCP